MFYRFLRARIQVSKLDQRVASGQPFSIAAAVDIGQSYEPDAHNEKPGESGAKNSGNAIMVDVTDKEVTDRTAIAKGKIKVSRAVFEAIKNGTAKKGDVLGVARVAGIMATKRTSDLIPMCHVLMITKSTIDFQFLEEKLEIEATCTVKVSGKTGVEMEALTGVTVALLTVYDMCKAMDKFMEIKEVYLYRKTGGKSGDIENNK